MSNKDQEIRRSGGRPTQQITPDTEGCGTSEVQSQTGDRASRGGPKTEAGRRRASANAMRHGLLSVRPVVMDMEDLQTWENHREAIFESLSPADELEAALAERIATQLWRLRRVVRYETDVIQANQSLAKLGLLPANRSSFSSMDPDEATAALGHAEAVVDLVARFPNFGDDEPMEKNAAVAFIWLA
jgi:hypothetical protein